MGTALHFTSCKAHLPSSHRAEHLSFSSVPISTVVHHYHLSPISLILLSHPYIPAGARRTACSSAAACTGSPSGGRGKARPTRQTGNAGPTRQTCCPGTRRVRACPAAPALAPRCSPAGTPTRPAHTCPPAARARCVSCRQWPPPLSMSFHRLSWQLGATCGGPTIWCAGKRIICHHLRSAVLGPRATCCSWCTHLKGVCC